MVDAKAMVLGGVVEVTEAPQLPNHHRVAAEGLGKLAVEEAMPALGQDVDLQVERHGDGLGEDRVRAVADGHEVAAKSTHWSDGLRRAQKSSASRHPASLRRESDVGFTRRLPKFPSKGRLDLVVPTHRQHHSQHMRAAPSPLSALAPP